MNTDTCATNRRIHAVNGPVALQCDGWHATPWLRGGDRPGEESWYRSPLSMPITVATCPSLTKRCALGDVDPTLAARMERRTANDRMVAEANADRRARYGTK